MRLLLLRPVRSTVSVSLDETKNVSSLCDGDIVWDGSGFGVATQARQKAVQNDSDTCHHLRRNVAGPDKLKRTEKKVLKNKRQSEEWCNNDTSLRVADLVPRVMYHSDESSDAWFEKVSTASMESRRMRKELARLVLQSLVSSDDDEQNRGNDGNCTDRYSVETRHEVFDHEDRYVVPDDFPSTTVSALGSNTFETYDYVLEVADEVQRERERIRNAFVESMTTASENSSQSEERSEESDNSEITIGNFWHSIGVSCFGPNGMTPRPLSPGSTTIFWQDSISRDCSSLSY
jgi:hypothetical protein